MDLLHVIPGQPNIARQPTDQQGEALPPTLQNPVGAEYPRGIFPSDEEGGVSSEDCRLSMVG